MAIGGDVFSGVAGHGGTADRKSQTMVGRAKDMAAEEAEEVLAGPLRFRDPHVKVRRAMASSKTCSIMRITRHRRPTVLGAA